MSNTPRQPESISRPISAAWRPGVWRRLRVLILSGAAIGLSACVVLPADTVIYDDEVATHSGSSSSPDVVVIERGSLFVPPPVFWHRSRWGHRHGYRHRYRHGYRDGRRSRIRQGRRGGRWEGRRGRQEARRGGRQRGGEIRGRTRSGASPRSMTPRLETK